jgi:uncharacterized protein (TIGR02391 family)
MPSSLRQFELIVRVTAAAQRAAAPSTAAAVEPTLHPFDQRNIHPALPPKVKKLFDDGHYAEATFEAFKFLDKKVQKHAGIAESGFKLMMAAFDQSKPLIKLTPLKSVSEQDEQEGFRFVFAGGVKAIRNPRGHEHSVVDDPDLCLDHLAFVSLLLRRLEAGGYA